MVTLCFEHLCCRIGAQKEAVEVIPFWMFLPCEILKRFHVLFVEINSAVNFKAISCLE